jgi:Domain of unknown function (DUF1707)/Domain of unknown function (DUF4190)
VVVQMTEMDIPPAADKPQQITDRERGLQTAVSRVVQSAERSRALAAASERGKLRASDADRDRVVELLNLAYCEGQLSKDEYDARLGSAMSARTFADLDSLVSDLPAARPSLVPPGAGTTVASPVARVNPLAIASLACGLAQFLLGPVATIPAIVLGHVARSQIKRTGEQGAGLALAGLILGWVVVSLAIIVIVIGLAIAAGTHGAM